jgi:hypothetical protein
LLYAPVAAALAAWAGVRCLRSRECRAGMLHLGLGLAAGFAPIVWCFLRDPQAFWFNNVGYHVLRADPSGPLVRILGPIRFAAQLVWERPYLGLIAAVAAVGAVAVLRRGGNDRRYGVAVLLLLATFLIVSATPRPLYHQYFTAPLVPFLLPFLLPGMDGLRARQRALPWLAAALAVALFSAHVRGELELGRSGSDWNPANYREVALSIERVTDPDDVVLSFWPGYVFEAGRRYFSGMENHFAFRISSKVGEDDRRRYHVPSTEDVFGAVARREPEVVVVGAWMKDFRRNLTGEELREFGEALDEGYSPDRRVGEVWILRRNREVGQRVAPLRR